MSAENELRNRIYALGHVINCASDLVSLLEKAVVESYRDGYLEAKAEGERMRASLEYEMSYGEDL